MHRLLISALVFALLTACAPPVPRGADGRPLTTFRGAWGYAVPPQGHYNTFVPGAMTFGIYYDLIELPLAMYDWGAAEWLPLLAADWGYEGEDRFVVRLRPGALWSDGKPITARDVVDTFWTARIVRAVTWKFVDAVEAVDEHTVSFRVVKPSSALERYVLKTPIRAGVTYAGFADRARQLAASDPDFRSDAARSLQKELAQYRPADWVTSGPYRLNPGLLTEAHAVLEKSPTAWLAGMLAFDRIVIYNGETPAIMPLVLARVIDYATHGFPPAMEAAFGENGVRVVRPPTYSGPAVYFNHDVYPLSRPEVRRALAHMIDRHQNGHVSLGDSGRAVRYMAGFSDNLVPDWLTAAEQARLDPYAYDPQKAARILEGIGFRRGPGGTFIDDRGSPLRFEITVPAEYSDWTAAAEHAATQATRGGIHLTMRGVPAQQHTLEVNTSQFQVALRSWGAGHPHPHFSFVQNLFTHNYVTATPPNRGMNFPMQHDGIDLEQLVLGAAKGLDRAAQREYVARLALEFNRLLPVVQLWERYGNSAVLEERISGWPDDADPVWKSGMYADNPGILLLLQGRLQPRR